MKKFWNGFVTLVRQAVGQIVGAIVIIVAIIAYALLGYVLTFPYALLTGTRLEELTLMSLFAPVIALLLGTLGTMCFRDHNLWLRGWCRIAFAACIAYLCMPIAFHGISLAIKAAGWETASSVIFLLRFWSFLIVPIAAAVAWNAYARVSTLRVRWTRKPPTTPPSGDDPPRRHADRNDDPYIRRLALTS